MSNSTTNDQIRYTITIYGDVRGTCIAPLNKGAARKLREIQSRLDKNDDKYFDRISYNERLEKAVSKLKAVYSAWSYCADSFTMVVTEARKKDVLFKLHNHDPKLKITIADYYVDTIGVYIATTENSCGKFTRYELNLPVGVNFDPSLLSVMGVWPRNSAAGPLVTSLTYNNMELDEYDDCELRSQSFQADFFEIQVSEDGSLNGSMLSMLKAIEKFGA